jgi:hypothetical protein
MAPTAPKASVNVTAAEWRVLAAVAGGCAVEAVATALDVDEFGACKAVKGLVDSRLVELEDERPSGATGGARDLDSLVEIPKRRRRPVEGRRDKRAAAVDGDVDQEVSAAVAALSPQNAQELAKELTELGAEPSSAADAAKAATRAETPEERAAALEGVLTDEQGGSLDRGLLLKFLSSVRS